MIYAAFVQQNETLHHIALSCLICCILPLLKIRDRYGKTNLSKYIAAAKKGEKIYIGGYGKPEVALVALTPQESQKFNKRLFIIAKGKVSANDEAFSPQTEQTVASLLLGE